MRTRLSPKPHKVRYFRYTLPRLPHHFRQTYLRIEVVVRRPGRSTTSFCTAAARMIRYRQPLARPSAYQRTRCSTVRRKRALSPSTSACCSGSTLALAQPFANVPADCPRARPDVLPAARRPDSRCRSCRPAPVFRFCGDSLCSSRSHFRQLGVELRPLGHLGDPPAPSS